VKEKREKRDLEMKAKVGEIRNKAREDFLKLSKNREESLNRSVNTRKMEQEETMR